MLKRIVLIISIIIGFSTISGIVYSLDTRWAKTSKLNLLEQRLDQKILNDRSYSLQERIWKIEDRYTNKSIIPETVKEELRFLKLKKEKIELELIILDNKKVKND